eukprot:TRINITY_DN4249_c0_g1_i1.p1 TRINITY_DN4249_c0_g1~~TRINITY_DN4249_c0_g1_i1.p1  ORF type:complete len:551 (-),score=157.81 TRINITY_DN4249_c0_g1_i1:67-1719(-)
MLRIETQRCLEPTFSPPHTIATKSGLRLSNPDANLKAPNSPTLHKSLINPSNTPSNNINSTSNVSTHINTNLSTTPTVNPLNDVYNWSRIHHLAFKDQIIQPKSESEIISLLQYVHHTSSPSHPISIRPIGSGLSYEKLSCVSESPSPLSSSFLLDLCHLASVVSIQPHSITVQAAMTVNQLFLTLQSLSPRRDLPVCPGVIGIQTVSGAISTGTHGQGLYQSTLADAVASLRIVLANGSVVNIDRTHKDFGAYVTSMGLLGVITEVEFKTVPQRILTAQKYATTYEVFKNQFVEVNKQSEFVKGWWFPDTDLVHIWEVNPCSDSQLVQYLANNEAPVLSEQIDTAMNETISQISKCMEKDTLSKTGKQFETIDRFKNCTNLTGNMTQIYCKGIPVPQINCEIAIPLSQFQPAIEALKTWWWENNDTNEKNGTEGGSGGKKLHYPFIFRCTGNSEAWLSGSYGEEVCWIGFLVYLRGDGGVTDGGMERMREVQEILREFGGIPHLGKHWVEGVWKWSEIVERWEEFKGVRKEVDEKGLFLNDFMRRWFDE